MNSELDKIKSTITISLGVKNRLKKLKANLSYEDFILQLLRSKNKSITKDNYVELQKFERKQLVYSFDEFKIVFEFNKYNNSENYVFDLIITRILRKGKEINVKDFFDPKNQEPYFSREKIIFGYKLYFELLTRAIKNEIEPLFKHKGRFEDYHSWQEEFDKLGLSSKAFDNDVMEKLNDYSSGVFYQ